MTPTPDGRGCRRGTESDSGTARCRLTGQERGTMCGITDADAQDMWRRMNSSAPAPEIERLRQAALVRISEANKAQRELYRYEEEHGYGHMSTPYSLRLTNGN